MSEPKKEDMITINTSLKAHKKRSKTKMVIVIEYEKGMLMQRDIIDSLLEIGAGKISIPYYTPISSLPDIHNRTILGIESFCRWLLREAISRHDHPFYLDEYLHNMVKEWYHGSDP